MHVLCCQDDKAKQIWDDELNKFSAKMVKVETSYYLRIAIIREIIAWRKNKEAPSLEYADEQLKEAILEQRDIGWKSFLEGLLAINLINYQQEHYTTKNQTKKVQNGQR